MVVVSKQTRQAKYYLTSQEFALRDEKCLHGVPGHGLPPDAGCLASHPGCRHAAKAQPWTASPRRH